PRPPSRRLERLQGLHCQQGRPMQATQQQQDSGGQMGQGAVAQVILAPAARDFAVIGGDTLGVPCPFEMDRRGYWVVGERLVFLFEAVAFGVEVVNLAARACLAAIETTSVEEERPPHLPLVSVNGCRRGQGMHSPLCSEHPLNGFPGRRFW